MDGVELVPYDPEWPLHYEAEIDCATVSGAGCDGAGAG